MPQFFVSYSDKKEDAYYIRGDDYYHLTNVRRIKRNDVISLRDDKGALIISKVTDITGDYIEARALSVKKNDYPAVNLTLCQCLLKGNKFDTVIRKSVEIGAAGIVPVVSQRTVKVPGGRISAKLSRWNRIALEASKQSMRSAIPSVCEPLKFGNLLEQNNKGIKIIAHPGSEYEVRKFFLENIYSIREKKIPVYLLIGPEGGFTDSEIADAEKNGWVSLNFGFTEMRAETASIVLTSIIIYEWSILI